MDYIGKLGKVQGKVDIKLVLTQVEFRRIPESTFLPEETMARIQRKAKTHNMYVIWPSSSLSYNSDKVRYMYFSPPTTLHPPPSFSLLSFPHHPHKLQTFHHHHHHLLPSNPAADADADAAPAIHQSIVEDLPPPPAAAPAPPAAPLLPV